MHLSLLPRRTLQRLFHPAVGPLEEAKVEVEVILYTNYFDVESRD